MEFEFDTPTNAITAAGGTAASAARDGSFAIPVVLAGVTIMTPVTPGSVVVSLALGEAVTGAAIATTASAVDGTLPSSAASDGSSNGSGNTPPHPGTIAAIAVAAVVILLLAGMALVGPMARQRGSICVSPEPAHHPTMTEYEV